MEGDAGSERERAYISAFTSPLLPATTEVSVLPDGYDAGGADLSPAAHATR
jgi:hypothetical protein